MSLEFDTIVTIQVREGDKISEIPVCCYTCAPDHVKTVAVLYAKEHDCNIETAMTNIRISAKFVKVEGVPNGVEVH